MKTIQGIRTTTLTLLPISSPFAFSQTPTPAQQVAIDRDISLHFGDAPADPGPLATDLSPVLTPANIDKATRKVADWELARSQPSFDRTWTWSVLYTGFMAASQSTGDPKYRDAMRSMAQSFDWSLRRPFAQRRRPKRSPNLPRALSPRLPQRCVETSAHPERSRCRHEARHAQARRPKNPVVVV